MKRFSMLTVVCVIACGAVGSGCAFGTRRVNLMYGPTIDHSVAPQGSLGRIAVARLRDARSPDQGTGTLLGKVRNTYGIPTASVEANQDPVLWVNEGLARSLASQGFVVEKVDSAATAGGLPTVTGQVTRASGGMYMKMDANIAADLAIERAGKPLLSTQCQGSASKVAWTASAGEYRDLFSSAMDDFVTNCTPLLEPTLKENAAR
jgi:hypothetical protein